ncbi:HAUS augmin-like complex subunit 7 isoform X2 [Sceloporus undulatus]|uniref:HAUS augmin-like complex subunit 7 isoform X2 n=1 Tax=Sceloporus undulatus TaxID=8520 RepID=UPI001C4C87A9|nr:HAUS augmin-like complex subunit 7 isoform X2 [Sceloporus undulatus]
MNKSGSSSTSGGKMAADSFSVLYGRLKELGCPALEGVFLSEAKDMQKLLCTPSSHRLDILEWICTCVHPPLQEQFSSLKESESDLKIREMAKLGYELMLCQADDLDLIKGKASAQKQLYFLEKLVAVILPQGDFAVSGSVSDSSIYSSTEESFEEIARKNEEFIKQVFTSSDLQAVLSPECYPWSSDIKFLLKDEEVLHKRLPLSATSHEKTLMDALKELEDTVASLTELKTQCPFLQEDLDVADTSVDSVTALQTLKLITSDFSQLLLAFEQVYENELQQHCERLTPMLSPCGPLFQAVHESLTLCMQELQALAQVTETSKCLMETVKQRHEEKVVWSGSAKSSLSSKLEELKQKYKTIHATLKDCP